MPNQPAPAHLQHFPSADKISSDRTSNPAGWNGVSWNGVAWLWGCVIVALVPMIATHLIGATTVNPFTQPISHYVFVPGGYLMVAIGSFALAISALVVAIGLLRSRLRNPGLGWASVLLIGFAVAMSLVGIFPTEPPGTEVLGIGATIHRWSAAFSFAVLPVIGMLVGRGTRGWTDTQYPARLLRLSRAVAISVGIFFMIHIPMILIGSAIPLFGFLERVGFALMITNLLILAYTVRAAGYGIPTQTQSVHVAASLLESPIAEPALAGVVATIERADLPESFFAPLKDRVRA